MSRETRYKPGEFAQLINRSVGTLRIWDKKGKLTAKRLPSGHRYYTDDDVNKAWLSRTCGDKLRLSIEAS
jgi:DNA-binding transcriptional MerR regulator